MWDRGHGEMHKNFFKNHRFDSVNSVSCRRRPVLKAFLLEVLNSVGVARGLKLVFQAEIALAHVAADGDNAGLRP